MLALPNIDDISKSLEDDWFPTQSFGIPDDALAKGCTKSIHTELVERGKMFETGKRASLEL